MRPEKNPLDLNNLPEEYGKQALEESSTTTAASPDTTKLKKKKSGGKDESRKVYECRFCSLKFCKSQALGGHMNRHRQERETETLNRARQLVYSNEGLAGPVVQMGLRDLNMIGAQCIPTASFQHRGQISSDPCLQFRPVYPTLATQAPPPAQPLHPYNIYHSSSSHPHPYQPSFPQPHPPMGDYFIGHVLSGNSPHQTMDASYESNYTCVGAPLRFPTGVRPSTARDGEPSNQSEGMDWDCSYSHRQHMDSSS